MCCVCIACTHSCSCVIAALLKCFVVLRQTGFGVEPRLRRFACSLHFLSWIKKSVAGAGMLTLRHPERAFPTALPIGRSRWVWACIVSVRKFLLLFKWGSRGLPVHDVLEICIALWIPETCMKRTNSIHVPWHLQIYASSQTERNLLTIFFSHIITPLFEKHYKEHTTVHSYKQ